jgi:hypothetical protein
MTADPPDIPESEPNAFGEASDWIADTPWS